MEKNKEVGNKLADFEILKELGKGSYGTVYTVKSKLNSNIYVMKKMELNYLQAHQQQECYREVSILKKVSHQNIIKYYSSFLENEILYIIMEYAELGDLYSLIKYYKKHSKFFDEIDLWKIASEILSGLDYLHSKNIIHRDIKCLNLFITKDNHIKIGDLGVSTIISGIDNLHYTRVGTPLYISPELVKQKPYDYKTDIWSFGCSLYHLACLEPPFYGTNLIVLGNNIVKGIPKSLPHQYSNELRSFIDKMLEKKPENRPSAKEAMKLIPQEKLEKINGDLKKINIKRPFSSGINKIITINKKEIKKLFGENFITKNKTKDQNNLESNNIDKNKHFINNDSNLKIIKNNLNNIFNLDKRNHINQNETNNENNIQNENELKIFNFNSKNKPVHRNKENNIEDFKYDSANNIIFSSNNELKKSKNISVDTPYVPKKINDLSFNIPSFNNKTGFNAFRKKNEKTEEYSFENKNLLINKYNNSNYNYKIFSPIFKNKLLNIKNPKKINKNFISNNIIQTKKIWNINNNIKNENINNNLNNKDQNSNLTKETDVEKNKGIILNSETKSNLIRAKTEINKIENIKFPELNIKDKALDNYKKKQKISNNLYSFMKPKLSNITNNKNIYKRLVSAKNNTRSFSNNRPFTSKINKHFNKKLNFNNDTFINILKKNKALLYTKESSNSNSTGNYQENKTEKKKKLNFRPMTGIKPKINNNIMNININFYNIDMNKRFLIPEINPYFSDNEIDSNNKLDKIVDDPLIETRKFKDKIINNMDLQNYKNSNEFLFEKIIKVIKEINNNDKRLTINDLK